MSDNDVFLLRPVPCSSGDILPLVSCLEGEAPAPGLLCHRAARIFSLPVGSVLRQVDGQQSLAFQVVGRSFWPGMSRPGALLRALAETGANEMFVSASREGYAVACITLSDKGWAGDREDRSGPRLLDLARGALPLCHEQRFLLPDEPDALRALVLELALGQGYDLVLTSGGTGLSPRDLTPEALLPLFTRRLSGFEQKMMSDSLQKTPHAALSRAVAGTVGSCLVLALPGSLRGAGENLEAVLPALPHALEKLKGDPGDCGG